MKESKADKALRIKQLNRAIKERNELEKNLETKKKKS